MDQAKAEATAKALMQKHGLIQKGWTFAFNKSKTALGRCALNLLKGKKEILLSTYYLTRVSEAETVETVLHEIAHALDWERNGWKRGEAHGVGWQSIAREVGANPVRTAHVPPENMAYPYVLKYEGKVIKGYNKLPKGLVESLPKLALEGKPESLGKLKLFKVTYKD